MLINNCKIYCHLGIGKASIFIGIKNGSGWRGRRECKLRVVGIIRLRGNSIEYAIKHVHARNKYHSNDRLHKAWRILSGGSYSVAVRNAYKMLYQIDRFSLLPRDRAREMKENPFDIYVWLLFCISQYCVSRLLFCGNLFTHFEKYVTALNC